MEIENYNKFFFTLYVHYQLHLGYKMFHNQRDTWYIDHSNDV